MIIAKHSAEMAPSIVVQSIDRSPIALRQLTHQDARAVADLHDQLTEQDRYMRFFSTHPKDLGDLTDSLTTQSKRQLSVGAFDGRRLIGIANYAISRATSAEVALVVAHADQHRGIGTMLLKHLAELALRNGITRFTADVLTENHALLVMLRELRLRYTVNKTDRDVLHLSTELTTLTSPPCLDTAHSVKAALSNRDK
ncbi:GNAT family N-acetyltransferase [Mycobacteroides chelonae]|uniref:GNAT family N-acetyltransferase n=1 Tax=Mycobacteroides chelonae TaxID=1774 RepID=UPI001E428A39|nr:GNAT family N-acetyltransferase [Mycobacteroides chelonae]